MVRHFITSAYAAVFLLLLASSITHAQGYSDQVQEMYVAYYSRPGDPDGVDFWVSELSNSGGDLTAIIEKFGNSAEYNDRFDSQSESELINNIYVNLFGRDADEPGLLFYLDALQRGEMTLASIALNVSDGVAAGGIDANIVSNKIAAATAYTEEVAEQNANYGNDQIAAAVALIASVDDTQTSFDAAIVAISELFENVGNDNVDITDKMLTNSSGACSNYVGTYFSNVTDIQRAMNFMGDIAITDEGATCAIQSNVIPNHDFNDVTASFANAVVEQSAYYLIPASPSATTTHSALELGVTEVIMLNGVALDLLAAACYDVGNEQLGREKIGCGPDQNANPWRYDPMSPFNSFGTDVHNAHTQPGGLYHYHGNPMALFVQDCNSVESASPVIGFAADGFPVFGSCVLDAVSGTHRAASSSYALKDSGGARQAASGYTTPVGGVGGIVSNNYDGQFRGDWEYQQGAGDLDECNGMTVDGQYGYYVTDTFPWVINCFQGTANYTFGGSAQSREHSHEQ
jgi:hypothetical protein